MPARRPASPVTIVLLAAVGALAAGVAGVGAYFGADHYLANRPTSQGPGGGGSTTPSTQTSSSERRLCDPITVAAVQAEGGAGNLRELVYVRGADGDRRAEAWICQDDDGTLYYQAHELSGPFTAATSSSSILIGGVVTGEVELQGSTYVTSGADGAVRRVGTGGEFRIVDGANFDDLEELRVDGVAVPV